MSSTTDPTVPLPTATDIDDDDDDDDNVNPSLLPGQPPAATPPPAQPTVAPAPAPPPVETAIPEGTGGVPAPGAAPSGSSVSDGARPSSATDFADRLPSGTPTSLSPTGSANDSNSGGGGLGKGASAGISIGVALVVCLAAFGVWFFLRRRKAGREKIGSISSHNPDEEHAQKPPKSEIYAYRAEGPAEVSGDEKPRRWNELESPTYVAEVGDGQVFRAELPGSAVPAAIAGKKGDERLFADAPVDEVDEPSDARGTSLDAKKDERLFSDPPIDEGTGTLEIEELSRPIEKKN